MSGVYAYNGFNPPRPVELALRRGWSGRCPACGEGGLFRIWMHMHDECTHCGETLHHARISNAVPVVAVPLAFLPAAFFGAILELVGGLPLLFVVAVSEVVAVAAAIYVLPRAKGLLVGLAWGHHVGGFDPLGDLVQDPECDRLPVAARNQRVTSHRPAARDAPQGPEF